MFNHLNRQFYRNYFFFQRYFLDLVFRKTRIVSVQYWDMDGTTYPNSFFLCILSTSVQY